MDELLRPLQMADMSEEDRPREKALHHGFQSLSTAELLAILHGAARRGCRRLRWLSTSSKMPTKVWWRYRSGA